MGLLFSRAPTNTAEALAGLSTILNNLHTVANANDAKVVSLNVEIAQKTAERDAATADSIAADSVAQKLAALITPDVIAQEEQLATDPAPAVPQA